VLTTRALGELRGGVERALANLGEGFTSHPKNIALREALRSAELSPHELHAQLLRLVYRFIFLFVAEDRTLEGQSLLHPQDDSEVASLTRARYAAHYSTGRLREMAGKIKGSRHGDLWRQFQLLAEALSGNAESQALRNQLALPALGSFLWDPASTAALNDAELTNFDLLEALRHLAFTCQGKVLRPVDYKNLGAEELGGVYESLLALTPQVSSDGARFSFAEFAGNERKTSGSYYTPDSLVQCLLDSALDPVVEEAIQGKSPAEAEAAIIALKVCDPAVGFGHFLVGAAHRLAQHLARVRALAGGESEPSPLLYQQALRDVIGRCLYGVDVNPMAAELCRVSLWLEALEPGKPLSFLDHHIRVGNSLLGTGPELIAGGLPDVAFEPIEGDDKKICSALKKRNKQERDDGQMDLGLPMVAEGRAEYDTLASRSRGIDEAPDDSLEAIARKAEQFRRLVVSPEYQHEQKIADAWCVAFVWPKTSDTPGAITTDTIRRLKENPDALDVAEREELERLANKYQFFHWQLAFPEVFAQGGFDCVLANPPWERVKLQEKEWFAERSPEIANAPNAAARKRMIIALKHDDPELYGGFLDEARKAKGESHLLRNSGRYPLCGRGDINLYTVFAEGMRMLLRETGRAGAVLPTGIATDDTTKFFFRDVVEKNSLRSLFDFENRNAIFPGVHRSYKFCLFTIGSAQAAATGRPPPPAEFAFFCLGAEDLRDPEKRFAISPDDIALINPNTRTCPIFRSARDAILTASIARRNRCLYLAETKEVAFDRLSLTRVYDLTLDKDFLVSSADSCPAGYGSLHEGKAGHQFNHRFASWNRKDFEHVDAIKLSDSNFVPAYQFYAPIGEARDRLNRRNPHTLSGLLCFRRVARNTDERTMVACILPFMPTSSSWIHAVGPNACDLLILTSIFNSFPFDYLLRNSLSQPSLPQSLVEQIRAPNRTAQLERLLPYLMSLTLVLTYTAWDLEAFAQDCGWDGPPFRWDEERRFLIRGELDAAFFHLYLPADENGDWLLARKADGCPYDETPDQISKLKHLFPTPRGAVNFIMDTFPIVRRKDEEAYDEYRTKRVILKIYDEMQEAIRTGQPYETRLDPPPGPPLDADGNFVTYANIANPPPPHIHLPRDAMPGSDVPLQVSDLATRFPDTPSRLLTPSMSAVS